jgi:hypothetical protein
MCPACLCVLLASMYVLHAHVSCLPLSPACPCVLPSRLTCLPMFPASHLTCLLKCPPTRVSYLPTSLACPSVLPGQLSCLLMSPARSYVLSIDAPCLHMCLVYVSYLPIIAYELYDTVSCLFLYCISISAHVNCTVGDNKYTRQDDRFWEIHT